MVTALALQSVASCGSATEGGTNARGGSAGAHAGHGGHGGVLGGHAGEAGDGAAGGHAADGGRESEGGEAGTGGVTSGGQGGEPVGAGAGGTTASGGEAGASGGGGAGGSAECEAGAEEDADKDGWTIAAGDCNDCEPLVNPGAFEVLGNAIDDDCDGSVDIREPCDEDIASNTANAVDFARAIDLCQTATPTDGRWGVLSAELSLADGTGLAAADGRAVRPGFGEGLDPALGHAVAVLSTGKAAAKGDTNPAPADTEDTNHGTQSAVPADFVAVGVKGCPPVDAIAFDSEMLSLEIRVPSNARSFSLRANLYSYEFPEWVCSEYTDSFVVLLDSEWDDAPKNPADKNLAVYEPFGARLPMGTNWARGNTGLFTQCVGGATGCNSGVTPDSATGCLGTAELLGTGFDVAKPGLCDADSLAGGATGWRTISGNVVGGEAIRLRIALWDGGDHASDSTVVLDAFEWSTEPTTPGVR